jgi:hypothetical protein
METTEESEDYVTEESEVDAVACASIERRAPSYRPACKYSVETPKNNGVIGWAYLRRCMQSGSMRNRRRIWKVSEQLLDMVNKLAL